MNVCHINYDEKLNSSVYCGMWEESELVSKQMEGVGKVISNSLASSGYRTLSELAAANPRMLELAAKKPPPFGNSVRDWAARQPRYRRRRSWRWTSST